MLYQNPADASQRGFFVANVNRIYVVYCVASSLFFGYQFDRLPDGAAQPLGVSNTRSVRRAARMVEPRSGAAVRRRGTGTQPIEAARNNSKHGRSPHKAERSAAESGRRGRGRGLREAQREGRKPHPK